MTSATLVNTDKQKAKLKYQVDSLKELNSGLLRANASLAHQYRLDSVVIRKLQYDIAADGVRTERRLKAIDTLTTSEKVTWILNRYASKP